jgi:hypothetical protein
VGSSSSSEELDDILDGRVSLVIGSFEFAPGLIRGVRTVMETAVSKRSAQALVEEQKQQRDLDAFRGEAIGIAGPVTFDQSVALELAQVVAELVESVSFFGEMEGGEDGLVDLLGGPAANMTTSVQENFE